MGSLLFDLSQNWAEIPELITRKNQHIKVGYGTGSISVPVLSLVIRALSVSVSICVYVSMCSFALFRFALLAGSRNFYPPNRSWFYPSPSVFLATRMMLEHHIFKISVNSPPVVSQVTTLTRSSQSQEAQYASFFWNSRAD